LTIGKTKYNLQQVATSRIGTRENVRCIERNTNKKKDRETSLLNIRMMHLNIKQNDQLQKEK
jgi:hypothetical protein